MLIGAGDAGQMILRDMQNSPHIEDYVCCIIDDDKEARGKFIARMDGDDIWSPERFAIELDVLEKEHHIAIVSTDMSYFDESGIWGRIHLPTYPQKKDFLKGTLFYHASSMVRKEAFDKVQGYTVAKRFLRVEDYLLWLKMYKAGFVGKSINQLLYSMRDDRNAYSRRKFRYRINEVYVKSLAIREVKLPVWGYIYALKPILVGLIPHKLYDRLHKGRLKKAENELKIGDRVYHHVRSTGKNKRMQPIENPSRCAGYGLWWC